MTKGTIKAMYDEICNKEVDSFEDFEKFLLNSCTLEDAYIMAK